MTKSAQFEQIQKTFNEFNGENSELLDAFYDRRVEFQDPVIHLYGLENLKAYYKKAYKNVKEIEFEFATPLSSGSQHSCPWTMHLRASGLNWGKWVEVPGLSMIHFSGDSGKVIYHRDYVDMGEFIYENLPGLGTLIRAVKSQLH